MPIVGDAKKVKKDMEERYGKEKGERIFYATANKQGRKPETWKKNAAQALYSKLAEKDKKGRCWKGYKPVPGKKPYSEDSCKKASVLLALLRGG